MTTHTLPELLDLGLVAARHMTGPCDEVICVEVCEGVPLVYPALAASVEPGLRAAAEMVCGDGTSRLVHVHAGDRHVLAFIDKPRHAKGKPTKAKAAPKAKPARKRRSAR